MNTKKPVKLFAKKSIIRLCSRSNIFFEESLVELERYANGESWEKDFSSGRSAFGLYDVFAAIQQHSFHYTDQAVGLILTGIENWRDQWERSVLYCYWAFLMEARVTAIAEAEFKAGKRTDTPQFLDLKSTGFILGNCLALGWLEEAKTLSRRINTGLDRGWFYGAPFDMLTRRTQLFVLRLVASWQDWPARTELPGVYDVPVFNALLEQWRTPDVHALSGLLLEALDRHAEQTRNDDDEGLYYHDCNRHDQIYNPMEVLSVLRLREVLGLPNPDMPKHPVTDSPLGRELLPASPFPKDELLERVLARVRREYPDLMTA